MSTIKISFVAISLDIGPELIRALHKYSKYEMLTFLIKK